MPGGKSLIPPTLQNGKADITQELRKLSFLNVQCQGKETSELIIRRQGTGARCIKVIYWSDGRFNYFARKGGFEPTLRRKGDGDSLFPKPGVQGYVPKNDGNGGGWVWGGASGWVIGRHPSPGVHDCMALFSED